nr:unnamed protein product [Callosobruchus analis]
MNACVDFSVLGKVNISEQLDSTHLRHRITQNEEVDKNRHILRRLIMCIQFCGTSTSDNPGSGVGLINFTAEIDALLAIHMKGSQVFKGISKTNQNELLEVRPVHIRFRQLSY